MKPAVLSILAASAVLLSGCQTTGSSGVPSLIKADASREELLAATNAIRSQMRDPYSAQFSNYAAYRQGASYLELCIGVNGKNGFGGYVGERTAHVVIVAGTVRTVVINRPGHNNSAVERCVALERNRAG